jgi:adenylate cyclase
MFAVPVTQAGSVTGLVMLEDARRDPAVHDFARACATLVALATLREIPPTEAAPEAPHAAEPEAAADELGLDPGLVAFGAVGESAPHAMVLVLNLPDAAAPLAHQIACGAQQIAATHAIPYVKMLGTRIVAAAGYAAGSAAGLAEAAPRMADVAIALRERCASLLDADEGPAGFGLGLDVGAVVGGTLGEAPSLFNLWGEAVEGAGALAASAPAEAIQTSERAYLLLRQAFLFRPRGLFYRPRTGEARSYVLAGRA